MRRRHLPRLDYEYVKISKRVHILERIVQAIGFTPDFPYTLNVNDGTRNRVLIGKINGEYGIKIVDNAGATIIFADGHITADGITTGTLDANVVDVINLTAENIVTGTLEADFISGGTFDCSTMSVIHLSAGSIDTGSMHGDYIQAGTLDADRIKANDITADQLSTSTLITQSAQIGNAVIENAHISSLDAGKIDTGILDAQHISTRSLHADKITWHTITTDEVNYLHANRVDRGEMRANRLYGGEGYIDTLVFKDIYGGSCAFRIWIEGEDGIYVGGDVLCDDLFAGGDLYAGHDLNVDNNAYIKAPWSVKGFNCGQDGWVTQTWWFREDLWVHGNFGVSGSKGFIIEHPEDPEKYIQYTSHEGPEVLLRIRGKDKLKKGSVTIELPNHWGLVTEEEEISVMLTPAGDCNGLFVEMDSITQKSFTVKELQGGESGVDFFWEVLAVRKGYKDHPVIIDKRDHPKQKGNPKYLDYQHERSALSDEEYNVAKELGGSVERKSKKVRALEVDLVKTLVKRSKENGRDYFEGRFFKELSSKEVVRLRKAANDNFLPKG